LEMLKKYQDYKNKPKHFFCKTIYFSKCLNER
jgi:hypothetical protein